MLAVVASASQSLWFVVRAYGVAAHVVKLSLVNTNVAWVVDGVVPVFSRQNPPSLAERRQQAEYCFVVVALKSHFIFIT